MLLTKEEAAKRKFTARMKTVMSEIVDKNARPTPQPAVIHHPRFHNKPYTCQLGKHDLFTDVIMGIPMLTCRKCGWTTYRGGHEKNVTRAEMNAPLSSKPPTYLTTDIVDLFYPENRKRWTVIR